MEYYPPPYAVEDAPSAHLKFALRHEPLDLATIVPALKALDESVIVEWHTREPTGKYLRKAWFLYETFTGRVLEIPDLDQGNYVPLLDPRRHVTSGRRNSRRHRVIDNLLGGPGLCPIVRLTPTLERWMSQGLDERARHLLDRYDPAAILRAVQYLYTKETRSSFALEGEAPSRSRTERFVAALREASDFDATDPEALVDLQGEIVDMPDRRLSLFVRLRLRNGGRLAARKRQHFPELHDDEIGAMEDAIRSARERTPGGSETHVP